jgi:hypothetical protein
MYMTFIRLCFANFQLSTTMGAAVFKMQRLQQFQTLFPPQITEHSKVVQALIFKKESTNVQQGFPSKWMPRLPRSGLRMQGAERRCRQTVSM